MNISVEYGYLKYVQASGYGLFVSVTYVFGMKHFLYVTFVWLLLLKLLLCIMHIASLSNFFKNI